MSTQIQIDILSTAHNSIVTTFGDESRSENWRIDIDPVEKPFYGYGYGYAFRNLSTIDIETAYDYFNVIGILGLNEGFGIEESKNDGELPDDLEGLGYSYSFGYEYAPSILSNGTDSITLKATVYENNLAQPNVRVVFKGSPHIKITPNTDVSDDDGNVYVEVSLDSDLEQNTIRSPYASNLFPIPFNGFITIFCEIDKQKRENEGFSIIKTQAVQLTENSNNIFDISTYSFQNVYGFTYGYLGTYGYYPF